MDIFRRDILLAMAAAALPTFGHAQVVLPDTLRIIVPFPPGNSLDASARWFAETYRSVTNRKCIFENKPGAAATIAASEVSRSKPDGSVVLWTTGGHTTNAVLMKKLPYDPLEGFTPVTKVSVGEGFALLTRTSSPFNSVQDVVDAARKAPGKISFASAGIGNTTHVVGALFAKSAEIELLHVPYRSDFITDLMGGVVDIAFVAPSVVMPFIQSGKLKALGLSGTKRATTLPNLPNFAEFGIKDVDIPAYSALLAPPNMPADVLAALHKGVVATGRLWNRSGCSWYHTFMACIGVMLPNAHFAARLREARKPTANVVMGVADRSVTRARRLAQQRPGSGVSVPRLAFQAIHGLL